MGELGEICKSLEDSGKLECMEDLGGWEELRGIWKNFGEHGRAWGVIGEF